MRRDRNTRWLGCAFVTNAYNDFRIAVVRVVSNKSTGGKGFG